MELHTGGDGARHHHHQQQEEEVVVEGEPAAAAAPPPPPLTPRELETKARRLERQARRAHEAAAKWRLLCLQAEDERDELRARLGDEEGAKPGSPSQRRAPLSPSWRTNNDSARSLAEAIDGAARRAEPRVAPAEARRAPARHIGCVAPGECENDGANTPVAAQPDGGQAREAITAAQRAEMALRDECTELRERCNALAAQLAAQARAVAVAEESAEAAELECAALRRARKQELEQPRESRRAGAPEQTTTPSAAARPSAEDGPLADAERVRRAGLQRQRLAVRLMQRCASRWQRQICTVWSEHTRTVARQRRVIQRVLAARGRRGLGSCFYGWAAGTRKQRLQRRAVVRRLRRRQRGAVAWAFRSWLAEVTRVRDQQLRRSSTLVWDRHEKARERLLGRVADSLARMTNTKSVRAWFEAWSALVRDRGAVAAAESQHRLVALQEQLRQLEERARDAEEEAAAAARDATVHQQQIRKLQTRLKELTLANSKQSQELKRQHAQREISLYR